MSIAIAIFCALLLWASPAHSAPLAAAPLQAFIGYMARTHGFDARDLERLFAGVQRSDRIIELMSRPAEKVKPWWEYRQLFISDKRIVDGVGFWRQHAEALARAERKYGVAPEVIVAIIGVETSYGRVTGSHRVVDALATLAFHYPGDNAARADFFRAQLEHVLLLAREDGVDPLSLEGSYAGAMGMPQFMPENYRKLAVDFDFDGVRDIWSNPVDAIGSVANYLQHHGWRRDGPVVAAAEVDESTAARYVQDTCHRTTPWARWSPPACARVAPASARKRKPRSTRSRHARAASTGSASPISMSSVATIRVSSTPWPWRISPRKSASATRVSSGECRGHRHGVSGPRFAACALLAVVLAACGDGRVRAPTRVPPSPPADAEPRAEPLSKYGNPESYVVFGTRYYTLKSARGFVEQGIASWYGNPFHGRRTSSGEIYDMYKMTAAHKQLPLPTHVAVRNLENGRTTVLRVNDRGPFHDNRVIDLSYAAALKLGVVDKGTAFVEVRALEPGQRRGAAAPPVTPPPAARDAVLAPAPPPAVERNPTRDRCPHPPRHPRSPRRPVCTCSSGHSRILPMPAASPPTSRRSRPGRYTSARWPARGGSCIVCKSGLSSISSRPMPSSRARRTRYHGASFRQPMNPQEVRPQ